MKRNALLLGAAFLIACGIVYGAYHSVLNSGFLLDDFKHLGYAYNANHGDPSGLIHAFTGNWTGQTDGLTSFRPGISLSFWLDNLLFGLNAVGYHVTNLVVFSACTFLCGVLGYQLTADASQRERLLTGLFSIVLFASYPIHVESVSWIIGRVDVHCTFFYLLSISLYFQFRKAGSIVCFGLSIASFLASIICKEMAVTLPAVIAIAELLLLKPLGWREASIKKRLLWVGTFFGALAVFGAIRTMLLGTVVGGYGNSSLRGFFRAFRNNFFDGATFEKILIGVNEEQPFSKMALITAKAWWAIIGSLLLLRLLQANSRVRLMAFLFSWLILAELPTFQIWHIFPNLVGSRLFFLGSSAMCLLLAVSLVPAFKLAKDLTLEHLKMEQTLEFAGTVVLAEQGVIKHSKILHIIGILGLITLPVFWLQALQHNLYPWIEAGREMQSATAKLLDEARLTTAEQSVVLIDLPQDFSGAGMIGRPELLESMLNKPVADADYAGKFVSLVRPIPGPIEYIYPSLLASIYGDQRCRKFLHWSKDDGAFIDWVMPAGLENLAVTEFPVAVSKKPRKGKSGNRVASNAPTAVKPGSVNSPSAPECVWLSVGSKINPLKVSALEAEVSSDLDLSKLAGNARLVWKSEKQPKSWIEYSEGPSAEAVDGKLVFMPGRFRSWVLNGPVVDVGIRFFPGQYSAQVKSLRSVDALTMYPSVELSVENSQPTVQSKIMPTVSSKGNLKVSFDASKIDGAKKVVVVVTKTDMACPDLPVASLPDETQLLFKKEVDAASGSFQLPPEALAQNGKHQVAVLAVDADGKPRGYVSEPRTYFVAN